MEIRQVLRGSNAGFAPARPAGSGEKKTAGSARPSADRLELSREWVKGLEEQRTLAEAARPSGKKKSSSILDMLDRPGAEEEEADELSRQLKTQKKCMEIARRIMAGKRVPPEDEQYLMEHDPEGYKLAIAMRGAVMQEDEECESVLDEEDREPGGASETGEAVPAGEAPSGGGDAPASGGEE